MSSEDLVREAQDPSTPPGRLAELAQADRATWPAIVFNPAAYDGLLQWLGERGDPTVDAALAARTAHAASLNPPPAPPVPPAVPAFVEPQPQAPVEPEAPAEPGSPIAEPVVPAAQTPSEPTPEPAHEPTVVIASQQPAPAGDPEPTAVFPSQQQPAYPAAPVATTAGFGSVPPGATPPHAAPVDGDGGGGGEDNARTGKQLAIVIGVVVAVVVLVGGAAFGAKQIFGGDDDKPTISASDDATTRSPEPDDAPSTDAPSDGGDSAASGEFCTEMTDIQQSSMDVLGGGDGSTPDLGDIQDKSRELVQSYKDLEKIAPAEVKGDLETMSSYLDTMMNPSAGSGADGMDDYFAAAQRLGVYYAQNCL